MSDTDPEDGGDLGFVPAVPVTGDDGPKAALARPKSSGPRRGGRWRRRLGAMLALLIARMRIRRGCW